MLAHWYVFGLGVLALGFGMYMADAARQLPPGNAALPASLAFCFMGGLAVAIALSLKQLADRVSRLERQGPLTPGPSA